MLDRVRLVDYIYPALDYLGDATTSFFSLFQAESSQFRMGGVGGVNSIGFRGDIISELLCNLELLGALLYIGCRRAL